MEQFIMENTYFMKNRKANLELQKFSNVGNWKMGVKLATSFSFDHQAYADKQYIQFFDDDTEIENG
jgi:hypothetical protein